MCFDAHEGTAAEASLLDIIAADESLMFCSKF